MRTEQRVAFVTAGAKGLGQAIVKELLSDGWHVAFTYRSSRDEAESLVQFARDIGQAATAFPADLMVKGEVQKTAHACLQEFGKVDALIHNFGPFVFDRLPLAEYSDEAFEAMIGGNLSNLFWLYRAFAPSMRQQAFGRVITVGYDGAGDAKGWRYRAPYAAAKSGLASLTRSIAREERQNGITANMVCPGDIRGSDKMKRIEQVSREHNLSARPAVGEDVARMVVYLCQLASQQLNGTVTEVTGGYDILAYDDGQDVAYEPREFSVGQRVWVMPWDAEGVISSAAKTANRNRVYAVAGQGLSGEFTAFQLRET